jgi:molecular chaperone IbpA
LPWQVYQKKDLAIELADGVLTIDHSSQPNQVNGHEVIYQGLAQRSFKLQFTVAENVEESSSLEGTFLTDRLTQVVGGHRPLPQTVSGTSFR